MDFRYTYVGGGFITVTEKKKSFVIFFKSFKREKILISIGAV